MFQAGPSYVYEFEALAMAFLTPPQFKPLIPLAINLVLPLLGSSSNHKVLAWEARHHDGLISGAREVSAEKMMTDSWRKKG
ncbi:hypothetical protein OIU77_024422 [Salix suchowensis]|uniref:Uncharacterized protein n=1 Tax=Salix suchowensis TaxID=1278906 RepID=A0ABQ9BUU9_9ROSI|nr:hypothetical protein OIU77_024422 [Salix suchowensis]